MKKIKILAIVVTLLVLFLGFKFIFSDYSIYRFSVSKETRLKYLNTVDKVSSNKAQINWREVLAIDAVINYGKVDTATEKNIENIAERFLVEDNNTYKVATMESVMESFSKDKRDVKKANTYLKVINKKRDEELEGKSELSKRKLEFINSIKDEAIKTYKETGILPSVIIGQAALESNWGRSELASKYKNLFGIKADSSWKGEKINLSTSEYYNIKIKDEFRVYTSVKDSIKDFGKFLTTNPRYTKSGVFNKKTYKEQIKAIENAGYSTIANEKGEKIYASYVTDIIMSNDLQLIDWSLN